MYPLLAPTCTVYNSRLCKAIDGLTVFSRRSAASAAAARGSPLDGAPGFVELDGEVRTVCPDDNDCPPDFEQSEPILSKYTT
jgi:hypothetical protein